MRRKVVRDAAQASSAQRIIAISQKQQPHHQDSEELRFNVPMGEATSQSIVLARPRKVSISFSKLEPQSKRRAKQIRTSPKSRREFTLEALNRRGLILWNIWDGKPWHTARLPFFRMTAFSISTSRAIKELGRHEMRLAKWSPNRLVDQFWVLHYRAMLHTRHFEERLSLHYTNTSIIVFLLRTAPKKISRRFTSSLRNLEMISFELSAVFSSWVVFRRVIGHQHNRLYFEAAAFRLQVAGTLAAQKMEDRVKAKAYRMEVKTSFGSRPFRKLDAEQWRRTQVMPFSGPEGRKEKFEAFFAAFPLRWTIEPLVSYMNISLGRLDRLSKWVSDLMATLSEGWDESLSPHIWRVRQQASHTINSIIHTNKALHCLTDEFAALRYYRFQVCPGSYTEKEIAIGRSLWKLLHSRTGRDEGNSLQSVDTNPSAALVKSTYSAGICDLRKTTIACSPASQRHPNTAVPFRSLSARVAPSLKPDAEARRQETKGLQTNVRGLFAWER